MPRTRKKSEIPPPPRDYVEAGEFYRDLDVVTFISARHSSETRGVTVRSGVVRTHSWGLGGRRVEILDTTTTPKKGVPPRTWDLQHVRVYTVRRDQVLIAKAALIKGDY